MPVLCLSLIKYKNVIFDLIFPVDNLYHWLWSILPQLNVTFYCISWYLEMHGLIREAAVSLTPSEYSIGVSKHIPHMTFCIVSFLSCELCRWVRGLCRRSILGLCCLFLSSVGSWGLYWEKLEQIPVFAGQVVPHLLTLQDIKTTGRKARDGNV